MAYLSAPPSPGCCAQVALLRLHQDCSMLSGLAAHRAYPQGMNDAELDDGQVRPPPLPPWVFGFGRAEW